MKRILFVSAAFVILFVAARAPAFAEYTVCNSTHADVRLAVATDWYDYYGLWPDPPHWFPNQIIDTNVKGWSMIRAGACAQVVPHNISDLAVHIYAYAPSDPSEKWYGPYKRCLNLKNNFEYGESVADHEFNYPILLAKCGNSYPRCLYIPMHPQARGKNPGRPPCTSGTPIGMMLVDNGNAGHYVTNLTK